MRLSVLFLISILSMSASASQNDLKIQTIEDMYEIARAHELGSMDIFSNYASDIFSSVLDVEAAVYASGDICGSGGDDLWLSQDVDFSTPVSYSISKEGFVIATVGTSGTASYKMTCDSYDCFIDDVYTSVNGERPTSVKRGILNTCQ